MTKKILHLLVALLLMAGLMTALSVSVSAAVTHSGQLTETLTWAYDDGALAISGSGPMPDYVGAATTPWAVLCWNIQQVSVGEGVTRIGNSAFEMCSSLTKIYLPNSLKEIGQHAFYGTGLTSVEIPENVREIADNVFVYCSSLESVTINAPLTVLPYSMFERCTKLKTVNLPATLKTISDYAFFDCKNLTSIELPEGLDCISHGAFLNSGLTEVKIPDSITAIGNYVFMDTPLEKVELPASMTSIGISAFANTLLTEIEIPASVEYIGENAFTGTPLETVVVKRTEEEWQNVGLGENAFPETVKFTFLPSVGETPTAASLWLPLLARLYATELPLTVLAGEGGAIMGADSIKYGRNLTVNITPDEGYIIADVLVNGKSVGAVDKYTFTKVRRPQTIEVIFAPDPDAVVEEPVDDAADPMYSYDQP